MLDRAIVSYPENMCPSDEKDITLSETATAIDIESSSQGRYPIIIVPLHVEEFRKIGNLGFVIRESSYRNQTASLRFTDATNGISLREFRLNDLVQRDGVLLIGTKCKLACRKVKPSGLVILAITAPRRIIIHS